MSIRKNKFNTKDLFQEMPTPFIIGKTYSLDDIYRILDVPLKERGGTWNTSCHKWKNDWFVFSLTQSTDELNYGDYWDGTELVWHGKSHYRINHANIQALIRPIGKVYVFTRKRGCTPFEFSGCGKAKTVKDTKPVTIVWSFSHLATSGELQEEDTTSSTFYRDEPYRPFNEARNLIRAMRFRNQKQWEKYSSENGVLPKDIPGNPHEVYSPKEWKGYDDWLGLNTKSIQKSKNSNSINRKSNNEYVVIVPDHKKKKDSERNLSDLTLDLLSGRSLNVLKKLNITTVSEFLSFTKQDVLSIPHIGEGTWNNIEQQRFRLKNHNPQIEIETGINESNYDNGLTVRYFDDLKKHLPVRAITAIRRLKVRTIVDFMALDQETVLSVQATGIGTWEKIKSLQDQLALNWGKSLQKANVMKPGLETAPPIPSGFSCLEDILDLLPTRAIKVLDNLGILTIEQLLSLNEDEVMSLHGIGTGTWESIKQLQEKVLPVFSNMVSNITEYPEDKHELLRHIWSEVVVTESNLEYLPFYSGYSASFIEPSELHESYYSHIPIDYFQQIGFVDEDIPFSNKCTIGDILLSSYYLIAKHGINKLNRIRNTIKEVLIFNTCIEYKDFPSLVKSYTETVSEDKRSCDIFLKRNGFLDKEIPTLDALGDIHGVSRERIRQIQKNSEEIFQKHIKNLVPFWYSIHCITNKVNAIVDIEDFSEYLHIYHKWENKPKTEALSRFIKYGDCIDIRMEVFFNEEDKENHHKIIDRINSILVDIAMDNADERYSYNLWVVDFRSLKKSLEEYLYVFLKDELKQSIIPRKLLDFCIESLDSVILHSDRRVYSNSLWKLRHGNKIELVETILLLKEEPAHFRNIHKEAIRWREERISPNSIHSTLNNSQNAVLWDRGTFIHRDFVKIPHEVIRAIENRIIAHLKKGIPMFSVAGAFRKYFDQLTDANIPSQSALYSCLRISNNPELDYPKYPNIYLRTKKHLRRDLTEVLEEYIFDFGESIKYHEIEDYLTNVLGINKALVNNYIEETDAVIRIGKGKYTHIDNVSITMKDLIPLIAFTDNILRQADHVSVKKIFDEKRYTCKTLEISTPQMLYSLLRRYCSGRYDLTHYPQIYQIGVVHK